jgi:hypothetical protein
MFQRLLAAWRRHRATADRAEANIALIAERLAAAEARLGDWSSRIELQLKQLNTMDVSLARIEHQMALANPRFASPLRLERYGYQIFSQNDEDGIIAEIFRRIGETSRVFVEIAAGDGRENCSAFLLSQGWRGLWVECDESNVKSIHSRWPDEIASGRLKVSGEFVTRDNVDAMVSQAVGDDIDILIVDIDGNDYHILEAIKARPRVICAEYFPPKPPPISWAMPYDEHYDLPARFGPLAPGLEFGASLQALEDLLTPRGYSLVGTGLAGVNCFFVRTDLAKGKFEEPFTAENHYNTSRYWWKTSIFRSQIWARRADASPPKPAPKTETKAASAAAAAAATSPTRRRKAR